MPVTLDQYKDMIRKAGSNPSLATDDWIANQLQGDVSPMIVAEMIRTGRCAMRTMKIKAPPSRVAVLIPVLCGLMVLATWIYMAILSLRPKLEYLIQHSTDPRVFNVHVLNTSNTPIFFCQPYLYGTATRTENGFATERDGKIVSRIPSQSIAPGEHVSFPFVFENAGQVKDVQFETNPAVRFVSVEKIDVPLR